MAEPGRSKKASKKASKKTPDESAAELSFEAALQQLETIVDGLEGGNLQLEDALAAFEDGVKLTRRCAGQLEDAERRIEELVREGEKWITRPFAHNEESD
jgi:exodeoxyribonuclease VII small subunit